MSAEKTKQKDEQKDDCNNANLNDEYNAMGPLG